MVCDAANYFEQVEVPFRVRNRFSGDLYLRVSALLLKMCQTFEGNDPQRIVEITCHAFFDDVDGIPADQTSREAIDNVIRLYWSQVRA